MLDQDQLIAAAVSSWIKGAIDGKAEARLFVRISGLDRGSFATLARHLTTAYSEDRMLVRSTGVIGPGFEHLSIPQERSPTYYRNKLNLGQTLVLLWLSETADWESLKDLYEISDSKLCDAQNRHYLYSHLEGLQKEDFQEIEQFLSDLLTAVPDYQLQLRALTNFLLRLQSVFQQESDFGFALGTALPELGFFCHPGVKGQRNKAKVLRELYRASTINQRVVDDKEYELLRQRISDLDLISDTKYPEEKKRQFLYEFIEGRSYDALSLDWEEIGPLFGKKKSKGPKFVQWGLELEQLFKSRDITLSNDEASVIQDLMLSQSPNSEFLEELLEIRGEILPRTLSKKLEKEFLSKPVLKHHDFLVALLAATVELAGLGPDYVSEHCQMKVCYRQVQGAPDPSQAVRAFRMLYGKLPEALPSVIWDLNALSNVNGPELGEGGMLADELLFSVELFTGNSKPQKSVTIHWLYDAGGPEGLTLQLVDALLSAYRVSPVLPVFTGVTSEQESHFFGASRNVSQWRAASECSHILDLLMLIAEERKTRPHNANRLDEVVSVARQFCEAYSLYIADVGDQSLINSGLEVVLEHYGRLQAAIVENLQDESEFQIFLPLVNRAFVVELSADTLMVPLVHPLKLLAFRTKFNSYVSDVSKLISDFCSESLVNERRFLRNKESETSTANVPPCLSARHKIDLTYRPLLYAPFGECRGYELFRTSIGNLTFTDGALEEQTLQSSAQHLARVVEDYLQTYPYVSDGLEITFVKCPGTRLLAYFLKEILRSSIACKCRFSILVHTITAGAGIYRELLALVQDSEELAGPFRGSWFSQFDIKVISCSTEELFNHVVDRDLVFLVDCFRKYDQQLSFEESPARECNFADYQLPTEGGVRKVLKGTDRARQLLLNPAPLPLAFKHFIECQRAIFRKSAPIPSAFPAVYKVLSLGQDEPLLNKLHDNFNWVVCFDSNVDRHVLEQVCHHGKASVIRHLVGLGDKRAYNLTVSSSDYVLLSLQRRLGQELSRLLPYLKKSDLWDLSTLFSNEARKLSGDLVLRGVAPGIRINELIGVIFTHRQLSGQSTSGKGIEAWIYLDDYPHWFSKRDRRPDLLRVRVSETASGVDLHATFAEAKCVGEAAYIRERESAIDQVARALELFSASWTGERLDSPFWRRELFNAIAQSCVVAENWEVDLLEALRLGLVSATETVRVILDGHVLVVCHDGKPSEEAGVTWQGEWPIYSTTLNYLQVRNLLNSILVNELSVQVPSQLEVDSAPAPFYDFEKVEREEELVTESIRPISGDITSQGHSKEIINLCEVSTDVEEISSSQAAVADVQIKNDQGVSRSAEIPLPPAQVAAAPDDQQALSAHPAFKALADYSEAQDEQAIQQYALEKTTKLVKTLKQLNMSVRALQPLVGPRIVRLKIDPAQDTSSKPTKIRQEAPNLKVWLGVEKEPSVWNGNGFVAVDIPRPQPVIIGLRELLKDRTFTTPGHESRFPIGLTLDGELIVGDLRKTPHWLVGGSTGSGKSVFLRAALISLLLTNSPDTLQLVLIDPKGGLVPFDGLPHFYPLEQGKSVIFGVGEEMGKSAAQALQELTSEMDRRMHLMMKTSRTNEIDVYNKKNPYSRLPRILVVVEEYSDLLSHEVSKSDIEGALKRLTQMGRSAGIHVMVITQNPIAQTLNSTIKSNLVGRLAFRVSQGVNSMVILDEPGAESLLGNGDFLVNRDGLIVRGQAPFLDETSELEQVLLQLSETESALSVQ